MNYQKLGNLVNSRKNAIREYDEKPTKRGLKKILAIVRKLSKLVHQ